MNVKQSCSCTGPTVPSGCRGHCLDVSSLQHLQLVECLSSPPDTQPHIVVIGVEDTPGRRGHWKAGFLVQEEISTVLVLVFKFGLGLNQNETDSSEISYK